MRASAGEQFVLALLCDSNNSFNRASYCLSSVPAPSSVSHLPLALALRMYFMSNCMPALSRLPLKVIGEYCNFLRTVCAS
jgi:hypothetical protein